MSLDNTNDVNFRFHEDELLQKALDHISKSYSKHYGHEVDGKNIQVVDLWEAMGTLMTTSRDTAIKYLVRFGKKKGHNPEDLYKAIHYITLMLYASRGLNDVVDKPNEKALPILLNEADMPVPPDLEGMFKTSVTGLDAAFDAPRSRMFGDKYSG